MGNDISEVIAFSLQNKGYTVGIPSLGSNDSIAPAVTKGKDTYGPEYEDSLVLEGGEIQITGEFRNRKKRAVT